MKRAQRQKRIRYKIKGTSNRPRLSVLRSLKGMWVQLIDDEQSKTVLSLNHKAIKTFKNPLDQSRQIGLLLSELAQKKKINTIVFDRSGYKFHGRVKALADGAREGGLEF